jgi:putative ABC transport system substrate-binding protein
MPALPRAPSPLRRRALLGLVLAAGGSPAAAEAVPVLYPEIGEPFRSVFEAMLDGIGERLPTERLAVQGQGEALLNLLQQRRPRVVIALGRSGLRVALGLDATTAVVASGVISPTEVDTRASTLISLSPDPLLLLQRLRQLQPAVRRVGVVHSNRHSAWLIRHAQEAARQLKLELLSFEAEELRPALRQYQQFFAQAGGQDALWLPQDPATVDETAVLPLVLEECWNRNLPLFSSSLGHVRRGALFSLYPNNRELGRSLGAAAAALLAKNQPARGAQPLREVHAALNTRTASHLGIEISNSLQRSFELLLPER